MWNRNSGYRGNRMSVRAEEAYDSGKMPLSKWSKAAILSAIKRAILDGDLNNSFNLTLFSKIKTEKMKKFLILDSWHHTGSYFNETNFYSLDLERLDKLTDEKIICMISEQKEELSLKKLEKTPKINYFITALIEYYNWEGTRKHPKKVAYKEIVKYRSNDKLIKTQCGNKRITSVTVLKEAKQKTKFPLPDKVK